MRVKPRLVCLIVTVGVLGSSSFSYGDIIGFEAESGAFSSLGGGTFNTVPHANALGGEYITRSPGAGNPVGRADYTLNLPAGDYSLWARLNAPSVNDDSFFVPVNDAALVSGSNDFEDPPTATINNLQNNVSDVTDTFTWMLIDGQADGNGGDYTVTTGGAFNFPIEGREDGLLLDAFALVTDSEGFTGVNEGGDTIATASEAAALDAAVIASTSSVPEPASMLFWGLIGLGLVGYGVFYARRKVAIR